MSCRWLLSTLFTLIFNLNLFASLSVVGSGPLIHSSVAQNVPSTSTALYLSVVHRFWPDTRPPVLRTASSSHSVACKNYATLEWSISIKASSSSCFDFSLDKFFSFDWACLYLLFPVLVHLWMTFTQQAFFFSFTFSYWSSIHYFPLVFVCHRWCLLLLRSMRFHLSSKLDSSDSDAPDSSASSSWRYTVAMLPSFKRSTAIRLCCC
jgi:hypothetical protein